MERFVRRLAFILAFLLLVGLLASSNIEDNDDNNDQKIKIGDDAFEKSRINFGPISLDRIYAHRVTSKEFEMGMSTLTWIIKSEFTGDQPLLTFSFGGEERLINCDNLHLLSIDDESDIELIDCKPKRFIQDSQQDDYDDLPYVDKYVKANVMFIGQKSLDGLVGEEQLLIFPLKRNLIGSRINDVLRENNLGSTKFLKPLNLGFYIEVALDNATISKHTILRTDRPIVCSANLYISLNNTEPLLEEFSGIQNFKEFLQKTSNGFVLNINDLACSLQGTKLVSVRSDLLIVSKQDFPYFTVKHTAGFHPLPNIFEYKTTTTQERSSGDPSSYNTTIITNSTSSLFGFLNFSMFESHVIGSSGFTKQFALLKPPFALAMETVLNQTTLRSNITLDIFDTKETTQHVGLVSIGDLLNEVVKISIRENDDFLEVDLLVDRDFVKSVLGFQGAFGFDEFRRHKKQAKEKVRKEARDKPQRLEL